MRHRADNLKLRCPAPATTASELPEAITVQFGESELLVLSVPVPAHAAAGGSTLTHAEMEVVSAMLERKTNTQIARVRGTAARTVAVQVTTIFRKLGVHSRSELSALVRAGLSRRR